MLAFEAPGVLARAAWSGAGGTLGLGGRSADLVVGSGLPQPTGSALVPCLQDCLMLRGASLPAPPSPQPPRASRVPCGGFLIRASLIGLLGVWTEVRVWA